MSDVAASVTAGPTLRFRVELHCVAKDPLSGRVFMAGGISYDGEPK